MDATVAIYNLRIERERSIALLEENGYWGVDSPMAATSASPDSPNTLEDIMRTSLKLLEELKRARKRKPEPAPMPEPAEEDKPAEKPVEVDVSELMSISEEEHESEHESEEGDESEHDSDSSYEETSQSSSQSSSLTVDQPSPSGAQQIRRRLNRTAARKVRASLLWSQAPSQLTTYFSFSRVRRR